MPTVPQITHRSQMSLKIQDDSLSLVKYRKHEQIIT